MGTDLSEAYRLTRPKSPAVWAECVFVDPVADLAVFGSPDAQELYDEAAAYDELVDAALPLPIDEVTLNQRAITLPSGDTIPGPPEAQCAGWLLSLDRRWFGCTVDANSRVMWLTNAAEDIVGGMSGSPVVRDDGKAIGLVCLSSGGRAGGPNPLLSRQLPHWLVDELMLGRA